ncbi:hypothetical protein FGG08_000891 [Glutinoglossum americanum]|uniref:Microbial-type PARG catalytic domain-containing protein n=1 Tax=Glutinoglossum americanum TaxID=1670608 RepID=A0A9P8L5P6_9PEZI|nr:hypothetical protein FGG08_000891 [Glutinoglossum americanum]
MNTPSSSKGYIQTTLSFSPLPRNATTKSKPSDEVESSPKRSNSLAQLAQETKAVLPEILSKLSPSVTAEGKLYVRKDVDFLNQKYCPNYTLPANSPEPGRKGTRITVLDADSFDATLDLESRADSADKKPVAVLNMANARVGGGGWLSGALAQEEALCYRSSLSFTLKRRFYPLPDISGIYSPTVVIIRDSLAAGHSLLYPTVAPQHLPVVSVISVAAIRDPATTDTTPPTYQNDADRELMKSKIRMILRVSVLNGHRRLVLGALGCGAFRNPPGEVVECFREVFGEREFSGGWWKDVVFAVMDDGGGERGDGNFGVFWRGLNGVVV